MVSVSKTISFYLRSLVYGTLITGCALYGVVASIVLRLVGKQKYAQYTVARAFYYTFSLATGIRIKLKNEELLKKGSAVVISNHQSALDILILGRLFQPGYTVTSKKALQYVPFLGWFMLASGTFFLDRSQTSKAKVVLDNALGELKEKKGSLFMFPEGTRSGTKELTLLPFKKGAFHLAKQAKIPVIPVVVSNTSTIFNAKEGIFNSGTITMEVLEPVPTDNLETKEDVTNLANGVRVKMLEALERIGYSSTPGDDGANSKAKKLENAESASSTIEHATTKSNATEVATEEEPLLAK